MEYWTNGLWKACIHRVLSDEQSRLPFLYFAQSDQDTIIKPLKDCITCTSRQLNVEYNQVFGKTPLQFIKKWQQQKHRQNPPKVRI